MIPIIASLMDIDVYKIKMLCLIWTHYRDVDVTFKFTNRTTRVPLADSVNEDELREQLEHVASLKWERDDIRWLREQNIISEEFGAYLQTEFKLSPFGLKTPTADGQIQLSFPGKWVNSTLWETYCLTIINEMRIKKNLKTYNSDVIDILMTNGRSKVITKLSKIDGTDVKFSDFSTRRRFSYAHQKWCVATALKLCKRNLIGTSNLLIAKELGIKAIGTNAHELPMVATALAMNSTEPEYMVKYAQYEVLQKWGEMFPDAKIMLPDTYGTIQFLNGAVNPDPGYNEEPDTWGLLDWDGIRVDSMSPYLAAGVIANWYISNGVNPKTKKVIFSDGLDVDDILTLYKLYGDVFDLSFGWGTLFANDFRDAYPYADIEPISIVCKVDEVNGHKAMKISDNPSKSSADPKLLEKYLKIFGNSYQQKQTVIV
jgi:nicotinate phosphoribosyltransferase